jgi:hypothetical protein
MHLRSGVRLCAVAALLLRAAPLRKLRTRCPTGKSRLGLSDDLRDGTLYIPKSYTPGTADAAARHAPRVSGWGDNQQSLFALAEELGFLAVLPESRDITWGKEAPGFDQDVRYIGAAFRHCREHRQRRLRPCCPGRAVRWGRLRARPWGFAYGDTFNHLIVLAGGGLIEPIRRKGMPKIFIAHGFKDSTMPIDVSGRKNVEQLKKEGYDVTVSRA